MLSTLDAARRNKSPTENCCRILFMTCWHKFQMIFNGCGVERPVYTWCYSPIEKKQSNLVIRSHAYRSLSFLHRWKADPIFTRVLRLALSFRRHFPLLFFYPPSLSFCRRSARLMSVLCTVCSLLHIMSRHAPYCWLATSLFWYSAPTQFSKAFLKNDIPQL